LTSKECGVFDMNEKREGEMGAASKMFEFKT
jgi:hypothetical protein